MKTSFSHFFEKLRDAIRRENVVKTVLLSIVFCCITLGVVWLLIKETTRSKPIAEKSNVPSQSDETITISEDMTPSPAYVAHTARKTEDLINRLAYTSVDDPDKEIGSLCELLNNSADYLSSENDHNGAIYFGKIASTLRLITSEPFTDSANFSERVGVYLNDLKRTYPSTNATGFAYPVLDTDPNGATALAMLALYRQQYMASTGNILLTFGGNLIMGDTVKDASRAESFKNREAAAQYNYPLSGLASVLQNDTLTFVNLENPLTESTEAAMVSGSVKGSPEYAKLLKDSGVDVVSIANEGIKDYGNTGVEDTKKALTDNNVKYTESGKILYCQTSAGTVAYISYDIINQTSTKVNLTLSKTKAAVDCSADIKTAKDDGAKIVVVHFNWINTDEPSYEPSNVQIKTARSAVDSGADLVFATHPDGMESLEKYKNVCIVYSPGNLSKNGTAGGSAFLFQQAFTVNGETVNRGDIQVFPIVTAHEGDGVPTLLLDGSSSESFGNTLVSYSSFLKTGLNKQNDFKKESIHLIAIDMAK